MKASQVFGFFIFVSEVLLGAETRAAEEVAQGFVPVTLQLNRQSALEDRAAPNLFCAGYSGKYRQRLALWIADSKSGCDAGPIDDKALIRLSVRKDEEGGQDCLLLKGQEPLGPIARLHDVFMTHSLIIDLCEGEFAEKCSLEVDSSSIQIRFKKN